MMAADLDSLVGQIPMGTYAEIGAAFDFPPQVSVDFADRIEISLDCLICLRTRRTILFRGIDGDASCIKRGHPFPGKLLEKSIRKEDGLTKVVYRVGYATSEFMDAKRSEPSVRHPTWARISFDILCPCGSQKKHSTQNNICRPYINRCACKRQLFSEISEQPCFRTYTSDGKLVGQQDITEIVLRINKPKEIAEQARSILIEVTGCSWQELVAEAEAGHPVYRQDIFHIENPPEFSQNLERMVFALIDEGADFELEQGGRSLVPGYRHRYATIAKMRSSG
jgi:hypothetical protein